MGFVFLLQTCCLSSGHLEAVVAVAPAALGTEMPSI